MRIGWTLKARLACDAHFHGVASTEDSNEPSRAGVEEIDMVAVRGTDVDGDEALVSSRPLADATDSNLSAPVCERKVVERGRTGVWRKRNCAVGAGVDGGRVYGRIVRSRFGTLRTRAVGGAGGVRLCIRVGTHLLSGARISRTCAVRRNLAAPDEAREAEGDISTSPNPGVGGIGRHARTKAIRTPETRRLLSPKAAKQTVPRCAKG